jgi:hypothetical protein
MRTRACAAAAVSICLLAGAAWGCEGKTVIFEDDFRDDLGGWDPAPVMKIDNGSMILRLPHNRGAQAELNVAFLAPADMDLCADVVFPTEAPEAGPVAGLVFWATDYSNLYVAQVTMKGWAALFMRNDGKWWKLWDQEVAHIRQGPGASNRLRVRAKGSVVSVYVNGQKVRDSRAQPPTVQARFGAYVERERLVDGHAFLFRNFKVTQTD